MFDHHAEVGGGQVVLQRIIDEVGERRPVYVVAPREATWVRVIRSGVTVLEMPGFYRIPADVAALEGSSILVANTYPVLLSVLRTARALRRRDSTVTTLAILHGNPKGIVRRAVLRLLLRGVDACIPVEPGVSGLSRRCVPMGILGIAASDVPSVRAQGPIRFTGGIKAYGRPDRMKGLHLLPRILRGLDLESRHVSFQVALGQSVEGRARYETSLRRALQPWLAPGRRGPDWIQAGDVLLFTSTFYETASLTVQEALARGAFVVGSRVGAVPYLVPVASGLVTFSPGSVVEAQRCIEWVLSLPPTEFDQRCRASADAVRSRAGLWYRSVADQLVCLDPGGMAP
jgi:hypothetical protein